MDDLEFRDFPAYPGYRLGSDGSFWSQWCQVRDGKGRISWLRQDVWITRATTPNQHGYHFVRIMLNGRRHQELLHLAMLRLFVGPRPSGLWGCHNNGNKDDCSIGNLRWDTRSANELDKIAHGTSNRGSRNGMAKLTEQEAATVMAKYLALPCPGYKNGKRKLGSVAALAKEHGLTRSGLMSLVRGDNWAWHTSPGAPHRIEEHEIPDLSTH